MRYIPQSKYTFDEICQQCHDAINRPPVNQQLQQVVTYNDILHFYRQNKQVLVAR